METSPPRFSAVPRLTQVPPPPRRPSPLARRLVFAYAGSQAALRIAGIVFLLTGLVLTAVMGWGLWVDAAIVATRATTTGELIDAELDTHLRIRGRHPFRVAYAYDVGGTTYRGEYVNRVEPPEGSTFAIEYASAAPRWSRVAGSTHAWVGWWGLAPLLVAALGVWGLLSVARSNRREIRAFVHGRPVLARVTFRGEDPSVELNGRHPRVVRWEFRGPTGEVFEGSISSTRPEDLEPFEHADEVVVLHDPDDPRANTLYVA